MRSFLPLIFFICVTCLLSAADITATLDSSDGTSGFVVKNSAGTEKGRISSMGNMTLSGTVEASAGLVVDTNTLFVNSATNKVGIGTANPGTSLEVAGSIKASGYVILPSVPAFRACKIDNTQITFLAGYHVYPDEEFDNGNNYNPADGRFTAPVNGIYFFKIHFFLHTGYANTSNNYISLCRNGTVVRTANFGANGYDGGFELSAVMKLDAGDYVSSYSGNNIVTWGNVYNSFEGFLVSGI
ncbi:MAG: hypothetical protein PHQ23_17260 [Candidatus Wallbacteria bacterium]|nr:hypothetical protein [Candidatus Wallbacteria bacterium]